MVVDFRIFREGSKANNNPGSLESRVWLIKGSAWNNPMGDFPGKKRVLGTLKKKKSFTSPISRIIYVDMYGIGQKW